MVSIDVVIKNESGMDSKFTALLIQKASVFASNIMIEKGERKANAKSLLGLLSLSVGKGSKITITADGKDEELAIRELEQYVNSIMG